MFCFVVTVYGGCVYLVGGLVVDRLSVCGLRIGLVLLV